MEHDPQQSLCKCLHGRDKHQGMGRCLEEGCPCEQFRLLKGARELSVPILEQQLKKIWEPVKNRSWLKRVVRRWIGLEEDVTKGELFEKLVMANIMHQASIASGLRNDLDASNNTQNPVNTLVVDLDQRLSFYEKNNDGLHATYRKLVRIRTEEQIKRERAEAAAQRKAVTKELLDHAQFGELLDCKSCGKNVDGPDEKCPECSGLGVIPNPDYIPPTEEINGDSSESEGAATGPQLVSD